MKVVALVLVICSLVAVVFLANRSREEVPRIAFYDVRINDVETVFAQLKETGADESYGLFAFDPRDPNEESHVELQFSIEAGSIGFDWVLLGELKARDADKFVAHAERLGHRPKLHELNNVRYIRVQDGDLVGLCVSVMETFYGVMPSTPVELVAKGFKATGFPLSTR